jgi:cellulose synthase/poly-beta-1,6-N-acetylglucosamine synthase-like glycosyltransferase
MEMVFWLSAAAVVYGYAGYPALLWLLCRAKSTGRGDARVPTALPSVTMIVPVHNEDRTIDAKIVNTRSLVYEGRLAVLFVSDGSTDRTVPRLRAAADDRISVVELADRGGKASALNAGMARADGDIVVFSDASIMLEPSAITEIVQPFHSATVGCVSGEDRIAQFGGEALYGSYELFMRRMESRLYSIVGASGSLYAQRRHLCEAFPSGLSPDFVSVLRTVQQGYRAVSEPKAVGTMTALGDPTAEFGRKVRTILRGITTLAHYRSLLNPLRYGWFAFELISHKVMRWLIPFFLGAMSIASVVLAMESAWYLVLALLQLAFYGLAALTAWGSSRFARSLPGKVSLYFTSANVATAMAWLRFLMGHRQEIWSPSRR